MLSGHQHPRQIMYWEPFVKDPQPIVAPRIRVVKTLYQMMPWGQFVQGPLSNCLLMVHLVKNILTCYSKCHLFRIFYQLPRWGSVWQVSLKNCVSSASSWESSIKWCQERIKKRGKREERKEGTGERGGFRSKLCNYQNNFSILTPVCVTVQINQINLLIWQSQGTGRELTPIVCKTLGLPGLFIQLRSLELLCWHY